MTDKALESFNTKGIWFVSDHLSYGMLRQMYPELFDESLLTQSSDVSGNQYQGPRFLDGWPERVKDSLHSLYWTERLVAACAFADVIGVDRPEPAAFRVDELKVELASNYVKFGLAAGLNEAQELIRDIERQVRAQFSGVRR